MRPNGERLRTAGKVAIVSLALTGIFFLLLTFHRDKPQNLDPDLVCFLRSKRAQAHDLATAANLKMPVTASALLDDLVAGRWSQATNTFYALQAQSGRSGMPAPVSPARVLVDTIGLASQRIGLPAPKDSALEGAPWHAIVDAHWACVLAEKWRREPLQLITTSIQETVLPGAVFFGDTDLGRFAVSRSVHALPADQQFWIITQNQLCDQTYQDYVHFLAGANLALPTGQEVQTVYSRYYAGAYGTGTVAVAAMNADLGEFIFQHNDSRRFFMEASWYVPEWTRYRALPRGFVFELARVPLSRLDEEILEQNRQFWSTWCLKLLGNEIAPAIPIDNLCRLVESLHLKKDPSLITADHDYLSDTIAQDWFGMARHATAALYQWRCVQAFDVEEKQRMLAECLFAYKQTFALSPVYSLDFANLLSEITLTNDAKLILSLRNRIAARSFSPGSGRRSDLPP